MPLAARSFSRFVRPSLPASGKHVVSGAVRRTDEREFVEIVLHAGFAEHRVGDHAAADVAEHQAVGARHGEYVIGRLAPAAAVHVLVHEGRIAGNILLQKRQHRAHAIVSRSTGRAAVQKGNRLALIKRRLGKVGHRRQQTGTEQNCHEQQCQSQIGKRNSFNPSFLHCLVAAES